MFALIMMIMVMLM